jgi:hypothetical protein
LSPCAIAGAGKPDVAAAAPPSAALVTKSRRFILPLLHRGLSLGGHENS